MSGGCCPHGHGLASAANEKQRRALTAVTAINGAMVVVETASGYISKSASLISDMLDMLGDTVGAVLGRWGLNKPERWQAKAALAKGGFMMCMGLGALAVAASHVLFPVIPAAGVMGAVGGLAFAANALCAGLLYPHRNDNLNMKSSFLCARNDMIANVGVLVAAAGTHLFASGIPDIVVSSLVSALVIKSSAGIIRQSVAVIQKKEASAPEAESATVISHRHDHVHIPAKGLDRTFNKGACIQDNHPSQPLIMPLSANSFHKQKAA